MLADFCSTRITTTPMQISNQEQGTASFMAPELLSPTEFGLDKGVPSKEADVYALGMTVYQVLTGKLPFFPRREESVVLAVMSGERPPRPENAEEIGMTVIVWDLLIQCWKEDRTARPTIGQILEKFQRVINENTITDSPLQEPTLPLAGTRKRSAGFSHYTSPTAVSRKWSRSCSLFISSTGN